MENVYVKQLRSVLELVVPAWHADITERKNIERVGKTAAHII